jgi:hypothetical protein
VCVYEEDGRREEEKKGVKSDADFYKRESL